MPIPQKRGRGRPSTAPGQLIHSSVRLNKTTKTVIIREFGSLAKALLFLADGIAEFRQFYGLRTHREQARQADELKNKTLTTRNLKTIKESLEWSIRISKDRHAAEPYNLVLDKINRALERPTKVLQPK